jgi:hypothetical protein
MDGTDWNDDVAGNGCDEGVDGLQDAVVRFPGEDLLFQMNASDLKIKKKWKTPDVSQKTHKEAVLLHAMQAPRGRGGITPTHSCQKTHTLD